MISQAGASVLLFLMGASVGSFAGFLAARWPVSMADLMGRSQCDGCARRLGIVDLFPILGYALRRGRCKACGHRVTRFYPILEMFGGAIGLSAVLLPNGVVHPYYILCVGWLLLILSAIDWRTFLLPDWGTLSLILGGLAVAWLDPQWVGLQQAALGAAIGYGVLALISWTYERLRGHAGLGLGDAKLLAGAGAWLGPLALPQLMLTASLAGLACAALMSLSGKEMTAKTAIPFGPFISLGFLIGLIEPDILGRLLYPYSAG